METESETRVEHEVSFKEDPEGDMTRVRDIQGPQEIGLLDHVEASILARNPLVAAYRIASEQSQVVVRGKQLERKQLAVLTVDISGSMYAGIGSVLEEELLGQRSHLVSSVMAAIGILKNRIEHARAGNAEIHWNLFATKVGEFTKEPRDDLSDDGSYRDNIWGHIRYVPELGAGTDIRNALVKAVEKVQELYDPKLHSASPEIIIVTDGEGAVPLSNRSSYETSSRELIRINTFFIKSTLNNASRYLDGSLPVNRLAESELPEFTDGEYTDGENKSLIEYQAREFVAGRNMSVGSSTEALIILALATGGGVWYIDPATGTHVNLSDYRKFLKDRRPINRYNPYRPKKGGWR